MKFAKLFETNGDQVLVLRDEGEEGPELRVFFTGVGLAVCNYVLQYKYSLKRHATEGAAERLRDAMFDEITEEQARKSVAEVLRPWQHLENEEQIHAPPQTLFYISSADRADETVLAGLQRLVRLAQSEALGWLPEDDPQRAEMQAAIDWIETLSPVKVSRDETIRVRGDESSGAGHEDT